MKEKKTLSEIITKARAGRAISQDYVEETVGDFLYSPLENIYPLSNNPTDVKEEITELKRVFGAKDSSCCFAQLVKSYYKKDGNWEDEDEVRDMDFYYALLLPSIGTRSYPFYQLTVIDYLEMAGMESEFKQWFRQDAEVWSGKHSGKEVTIGAVLRGCTEIFMQNDYMYAYKQNLPKTPVQAEYSGRGFYRDRKQNKNDVVLATEWIWLLLVKAPYKWNKKISEQYHKNAGYKRMKKRMEIETQIRK